VVPPGQALRAARYGTSFLPKRRHVAAPPFRTNVSAALALRSLRAEQVPLCFLTTVHAPAAVRSVAPRGARRVGARVSRSAPSALQHRVGWPYILTRSLARRYTLPPAFSTWLPMRTELYEFFLGDNRVILSHILVVSLVWLSHIL